MPAIQAAREAARRAQCISNQRQVAFALQNYEFTKKSFPPLRGPLKPSTYRCSQHPDPSYAPGELTDLTEITELSWVGFLLPFIEQNTAWGQINDVAIDPELYQLVLPVMQCRSSGISSGDNRINYVANAGPLNFYNQDWAHPGTEFVIDVNPPRSSVQAKHYTVFFDHLISNGVWSDLMPNRLSKMKITIDNITSLDGTSNTILLSENEDAGKWIWEGIPNSTWAGGAAGTVPLASWHLATDPGGRIICGSDLRDLESVVGFCYPNTYGVSSNGILDFYYDGTAGQPVFINEGRANSSYPAMGTEAARPSSGHPGGVVAAFVDGGVRFLRDDMDKTLFVRLARPGSGVILNPKDIFD